MDTRLLKQNKTKKRTESPNKFMQRQTNLRTKDDSKTGFLRREERRMKEKSILLENAFPQMGKELLF